MFYLVIESEPPRFMRSTSLVKMFDVIQTEQMDNWLLSNEPCLDDDDRPMHDEQFAEIK